jgi:hypothetical protein
MKIQTLLNATLRFHKPLGQRTELIGNAAAALLGLALGALALYALHTLL